MELNYLLQLGCLFAVWKLCVYNDKGQIKEITKKKRVNE